MQPLNRLALGLRPSQLFSSDLAMLGLPPPDEVMQMIPFTLLLHGPRHVSAEAAGAHLGPNLLGKLLG